MSEPFTFRTMRNPKDRIVGNEVPVGGDSVVTLALHRTSIDPEGPIPREAANTGAAKAVDLLVEVENDQRAEIFGPEQPIAAMTAPDIKLPATVQNLPVPEIAGRLYLVTRARGGVGATTFAVNLALGLCSGKGKGKGKGKGRAALVDLDLQFGTVASSLDLVDRGGLLALVQLPQEPDSMAVGAALQRHVSGLSVLPAPRRPIPLDALDGLRIASILNALLASHDSVVVDLPPALVTWLEPLLRRATKVFMVTDLAVPSIDSARRVLDVLREDRADLPVEVVITKERKPLFGSKLPAEVATALDASIGHWLSDDPKLVRSALDRGEPVMASSPTSSLARSIRKIAEDLGI